MLIMLVIIVGIGFIISGVAIDRLASRIKELEMRNDSIKSAISIISKQHDTLLHERSRFRRL